MIGEHPAWASKVFCFYDRTGFLMYFSAIFCVFFFDTSGCLFFVCLFATDQVFCGRFLTETLSMFFVCKLRFLNLPHLLYFDPTIVTLVSLIPRNRISLHFQNPRICFGKNWLSSGFLASPPPCQVSPTIREREGGKKGNKRTLTAQPGVENRIKSKYGLSGKLLFISIFFI